MVYFIKMIHCDSEFRDNMASVADELEFYMNCALSGDHLTGIKRIN